MGGDSCEKGGQVARLDEIAEGLAVTLASDLAPNPLLVTFTEHSPSETAFLVRAVVNAAERNGVRLERAGVSEAVALVLRNDPDGGWRLPLSTDLADDASVTFWRFIGA